MDSINEYVNNGQAEWLFIPEAVSRWKNDYASQSFIIDCDSMSSGNTSDTMQVPTNYCSSSGNSANEYINNITLGSLLNNTSGNNNGYGDYTSTVINLTAGQSYSISLKPGFTTLPRK